MKKAIFIVVFFCSAMSVFAEFSLGIMANIDYWDHSTQGKANNSGTTSTTGTSLTVGPAFRIMLTNDIELTPELGVKANNDDWGSVINCGLYFHCINLDHFSFSLGPKLNSSFYFTKTDVNFGIGLPLNFDLNINRTFGLRLSMAALGWGYNYREDSDNKYMDSGFKLGPLTDPTATLFITF